MTIETTFTRTKAGTIRVDDAIEVLRYLTEELNYILQRDAESIITSVIIEHEEGADEHKIIIKTEDKNND